MQPQVFAKPISKYKSSISIPGKIEDMKMYLLLDQVQTH